MTFFQEGIMGVRSFRAAATSGPPIGQLRAQIEGDETISDLTKEELLANLSARTFGSVQGRFREAQSGRKAIFKSRQSTQQQRKILTDRPGQLQTLLTGPQGPTPAVPAPLITGS